MKHFVLCVLVAVTISFLTGCTAARPMKLVVSGSTNLPVSASYTIDGVYRNYSGLMPATFEFRGRSAEWKIQRMAGNDDFRVEFYVDELRRTSTTSAGHSSIRGAIRYENNRELYWAEAID